MKISKNYSAINLILFLSGIAISFFMAELICQYGGTDKRPLFRRSEIPGLIYEFVPGCEGRTRGHPVKINKFGIRDNEFSFEKPKDTFRILGLGDSFTYGEGVALEETFLKRLEAMLNKHSHHTRYQAINAGCPAYNTVQEMIYLEKKGMNFQPDLVIVSYVLGDPSGELPGPPVYESKGIKGLFWRTFLFFRKNSYLFNLLTERLYAFWQMNYAEKASRSEELSIPGRPVKPIAPKSPPRFQQDTNTGIPVKPIPLKSSSTSQANIGLSVFHTLYDINGEYWPKCEEALAKIAYICRERSIPVLLVIWPDLHELNDNHPYLDLYEQTAESGKKYGMDVLALFPLFKGKEARQLWVSPSDPHPNVLAHQLAAKEIYDYLISKELINRRTFGR